MVVNLPSQKQHECLENPPEYFYMTHEMNKMLYMNRFVPAIQLSLEAQHIHVTDYRVRDLSVRPQIYKTHR